MSDLNIEKDDQATQEMLEMMGELSDEMGSTLQSDNPTEDDLLKELEGLPDSLEEKPPTANETSELTEAEEATLKVEDIDALMSELDENSKTSIEISTTPKPTSQSFDAIDEPAENTASKDTDEEMNTLTNTMDSESKETTDSEDILDEDPLSKEEEAQEESFDMDEKVENIESSDIESSNIEDLDIKEMDEETDNIADSLTAEESVPTDIADSVNDKNTNSEDSPQISQTQQAIETMEEAIQIDQEVQEMASSVQSNAQEAIQMAISTSEQAQQSAEQIQQAIEATLMASEQAFEAAKKVGYQIDTDALNTQQSSEEIIKKLQQIEDKNQQLKDINHNLKQRISELTQD
ncbi:hypothetical protein MNBD_GAMMA04-187 [hydrothermal vent metagenome]|uniref:Uncharacterized protein n=1 Tax=hydrothermal vent metagenome TaxID=652676 RepID=A0A3B0VL31_9ZZZZ